MCQRLIFAVLVAVLLPAVVFSTTCPPDCVAGPPDTAGTYPAYVMQPCNCSEFYVCLDAETPSDPLPCPGDKPYFDMDTGDCGTDATKCTTELPASNCLTSCIDDATTISPGIQVVAELSNCSLYYVCGLGGALLGPYSCPADKPYFGGTDCESNEAICCAGGALCDPTCYEAGTLIPDPYDCKNYYVCVDVGEPGDEYLQTCSSGNFDPATLTCSETAPCEPICSSSSGSGGGDGSGSSANPLSTTSDTNSGGSTGGSGGGSSTNNPEGTDDCLTSMECTAEGYFAMCHTCQPEYFYCPSSSGNAQYSQCSGDLVFNPNPDYPYCILPGNCPYNP